MNNGINMDKRTLNWRRILPSLVVHKLMDITMQIHVVIGEEQDNKGLVNDEEVMIIFIQPAHAVRAGNPTLIRKSNEWCSNVRRSCSAVNVAI